MPAARFNNDQVVSAPLLPGAGVEGYRDSCAGVAGADVDFGLMQAGDGFDEAQAEAAAGGATRAVEADEAFEDMFSFCWRDAGASVFDGDFYCAIDTSCAELDMAAFRGEFHGVVEQIGHCLGE